MDEKQQPLHDIWKFGQIILAGAFVVAAGLAQEFKRENLPASPLIEELKVIQAKVARGSAAKLGDAASIPGFMEKAKDAASISDLLKLNLQKPAQELINSMQDDEFDRGNPFYSLNNVYPVALIIDQGVKRFRRDAYRSSHFLGGLGYDVVKYEIEHANGARSYILAYKEKTGPNQIAIGHSDARPTFSLFVVPQDEAQVFLSLYQDGRPVQNELVDRDLGLRQVTTKVDQSTPLMTARDSSEK